MSERVDSELLGILVCPKCKGGLDVREEQERHVALDCSACALSYPVEKGIPVMLVEEARPLGAAAPSA